MSAAARTRELSMAEIARIAAPLKGCGLLFAALLGLGGCAADVAPPERSGYAQQPGMTFHYNAQMVGGMGVGSGK